LKFPNKEIRAHVIAKHVRRAKYRGVVVFTCGHAAEEIRKVLPDLTVIEVGPNGDLKTEKWWNAAEIHAAWPDLFDATSGHLPQPLTVDIAKAYETYFGNAHLSGRGPFSQSENIFVPTGSGETIMCLSIAFPMINFIPVYDNNNPATFRDPEQPLNEIIDRHYEPEYWHGLL
jgi:hypothetical protein